MLHMAISAVKLGGVKVYEAATTYNVPYSTLQCHSISDNAQLHIRPGTKLALSEEEENLLAASIKNFKDRGFSMTRNEVHKKIVISNYLI